jgi:hypothetical protein
MVIPERSLFYFPETPSTAGVLLSSGVMKFINIERGDRFEPGESAVDDASTDGPVKATGGTTMGMLVESIYAGDWTDEIENFLGND